MAIAHPGYEKIYSVDGYAMRSNSLKITTLYVMVRQMNGLASMSIAFSST